MSRGSQVHLLYCPEARWRPWRVVYTTEGRRAFERRFRSERRARVFFGRMLDAEDRGRL